MRPQPSGRSVRVCEGNSPKFVAVDVDVDVDVDLNVDGDGDGDVAGSSSRLRVVGRGSIFTLFCALTLSCGSPKPPELKAGVATVALNAPVGVSQGGYSQRSRINDVIGSPWAERFASSTGVHTLPTARAMWLESGTQSVAVVRADLCLVTQTLRARAEGHAKAMGLGAPLLVVGTHSHSVPARYFPSVRLSGASEYDVAATGMDVYDARIEDLLARSIAEAALKAKAESRSVSVGVGSVEAPELNGDRRCENDPVYGAGVRDTLMTVVRLDEKLKDGTLKPYTGFIHYAMHGTLLDDEERVITTDAPGAVELYGSDRLGIPLVYMQGAAGDVSPSHGPHSHRAFQAVEWIGRAGADKVVAAYEKAKPEAKTATMQFAERGVDFDTAAMGYTAEDKFPRSGGLGCTFARGNCGDPTPKTNLNCAALANLPARQTSVSLLKLGPVTFASLPGEPTFGLADRIRKAADAKKWGSVLVVGYAQDHEGYLLEEEDFLRGGYEATVSPWGWRFASYLVDNMKALMAEQTDKPFIFPKLESIPEANPKEPSLEAPKVVSTMSSVARLQVATLHFSGGDPALGVPRVRLEKKTDGKFEPVMASAIRPVVNGPEIMLRYSPNPTYKALAKGQARTHEWIAEWETLPETELGTYRFVTEGSAYVAGMETPYKFETEFEVTPSTAAGASAIALHEGQQLKLSLRFPPHAALLQDGMHIKNYRMRDMDVKPETGARSRGGKIEATAVEGTNRVPLSFTWDEAQVAFVTAFPSQMQKPSVEVAAGAFTDAAGNSNVQPIVVEVKNAP